MNRGEKQLPEKGNREDTNREKKRKPEKEKRNGKRKAERRRCARKTGHNAVLMIKTCAPQSKWLCGEFFGCEVILLRNRRSLLTEKPMRSF